MNANLQTAVTWLNMGVSPIPVIPKTKMPAVEWRMWQNRIPPKKVLDYWFRDKNENVGVICGGKRNLCIIDFDDMDNYYAWRKENIRSKLDIGNVARKSYRVMTPRGMHLYCYTRKPEASRKYPDTHIDVRCSGNYTLVPPSTHPSGIKYESIGNIENIVTIETIEEAFPNPVLKYIDQLDQQKREKDIFELAEQASIRELKDRINILSFVGQFSSPTKSSHDGRWWWARCISPNHKDKHPSFRIDTVNKRAKCMSAGCLLYHDIGYDVIDLYRIMNNLSCGEAIRELSMIY